MSTGGTATDAQRIFISYRREDSAAYAGRIYDAMVARFGEDNVFMDVELAPGIDFVDRITEVVSGCAALIVVIGPRWVEAESSDGQRRLDDPEDFVRREVGAAVQRSDVTVIPALVGKAQMPRAEQLPEELQPLARRNALELSDGRWRYDIGRLTERLEELLAGLTGFTHPQAEQGAPTAAPDPARMQRSAAATAPRPYSFPESVRLVLEGVLVAAVAAYLGRLVVDKIPESETAASEIAALVLRRAGAWGLTGFALALWLGLRTKRADFVRISVLGLLVGALAGAIGGVIWGLPIKLPTEPATEAARHGWEVLATAVTASLIGALIGTAWRPARLLAGAFTGLLAGAMIQLFVNGAGPSGTELPEIGYAFALRAAFITGAVLAVLLALAPRRSTVASPPRPVDAR